jgi:hypothetical protein
VVDVVVGDERVVSVAKVGAEVPTGGSLVSVSPGEQEASSRHNVKITRGIRVCFDLGTVIEPKPPRIGHRPGGHL